MRPPDTLDDDSFFSQVGQRHRPTLILFTGRGCRPCDILARRLPRLAEEFGDGLSVGCCAIDSSPSTAHRYKISRVPTLLLFVGGRPIASRGWILSFTALRRWVARILRRAREAERLRGDAVRAMPGERLVLGHHGDDAVRDEPGARRG